MLYCRALYRFFITICLTAIRNECKNFQEYVFCEKIGKLHPHFMQNLTKHKTEDRNRKDFSRLIVPYTAKLDLFSKWHSQNSKLHITNVDNWKLHISLFSWVYDIRRRVGDLCSYSKFATLQLLHIFKIKGYFNDKWNRKKIVWKFNKTIHIIHVESFFI